MLKDRTTVGFDFCSFKYRLEALAVSAARQQRASCSNG
jgi:hypothetical protein